MFIETVKSAIEYHDYIMDKYGDPRTKDWPLMSGPLPTIALCLGYIYFVKSLGPKLMENRKPFELKKTMIIYNAFMVIVSAWSVFLGMRDTWLAGYSITCQPCDFSFSPMSVQMSKYVLIYYFSKILEFLDTIFFVLRKKDHQVSSLHVIHHAIMPLCTWIGAKFYAGGHVVIPGLLNTSVHVLMYSYYLLAALGPGIQKYLWWKKYITTVQLVQFILIFLHSAQLFFIDCSVPIFFGWMIIGLAVLFFVLFRQFYDEAYVSGGKKQTKTVVEKMSMCMPTVPSQDESKTQ